MPQQKKMWNEMHGYGLRDSKSYDFGIMMYY